jgi:hypothetical protein
MKRVFLPLSLFLAATSFAADMPKPELYIIHEEVVKPSAVMAYEAVSKDFVAALTEKKVSSPALNWFALMTTDFHYVYVARLDSFAALDSSQAEWNKAKDAVGPERWSALERRGNDAISSYSEVVTMRRPDLSYVPANPRLKPEEHRYFRLFFYYLIPGKEKDAEALAKDYVALFKQKNVPNPFSIFMSVFGNDLPLLVVSSPAKSAADYAAEDERVNAMVGADVRPLEQRAMAITRRLETREGMVRPDLTYPPPAPPAAAK